MACVLSTSARAQAPAPGDGAAATAEEQRAATIAPADIPARADADEKFIQTLQRRTQASAKVQGFEQALTRQAAALQQLAELTQTGELSDLSVQRLETLERHWLLNERAVTQTRAELARTTSAMSEDAADLARRRAAWQATVAEPDLSPALAAARQRADRADRAGAEAAGRRRWPPCWTSGARAMHCRRSCRTA